MIENKEQNELDVVEQRKMFDENKRLRSQVDELLKINTELNYRLDKLSHSLRNTLALLTHSVKISIRNPKKVLNKLKYFFQKNKKIKVKQNSNLVTPKISVVIPIYDRVEQLRESIESILQQTYESFELILVCDGSPDDTLNVVKQYEHHKKVRIFYFKNNSGNAVRGRNKAIKEAWGEFIAFQDSDDIAEPTRLERSLFFIEEYKADVVYGGWRAIVEDRNIDLANGQEVFSPDCDYEMLKEICVPCQSTVMARLSALREVGGLRDEMRYREDHELWLRLAYFGYKFKSIPHILTSLRLHSNNLELSFQGDTNDVWKPLMLEIHKDKLVMKPKIAYLVPGCGVGGGIAVICQHVNRLIHKGYDVILISEDNSTDLSWFPNQMVEVLPLALYPESVDILVATGWSTAYTALNMAARDKFYFVQSDESRFYPNDSTEYKKALDTYSLSYKFMTEAKWIREWLHDNFNQIAYYTPNGLDGSIFYQSSKPVQERHSLKSKVRVLLEGPIDIPFKGMEDAFNAVRDLDCEVWCVSSAGYPKEGWRCDRFLSKVPMDMMKDIYSNCDILLKMSRVEGFFGPPLEMMACGGVSVVAKVSGYDEYIIHEYNALVVNPGDIKGAKEAIERLIADQDLRDKLKQNGLDTVKNWSWDNCINELEKIFYYDNSVIQGENLISENLNNYQS